MSRMNEKYYFVSLALSLLNRARPNSQLPKCKYSNQMFARFCLLSFDKIGRDGRRMANDEDESNDDNDVVLWHSV